MKHSIFKLILIVAVLAFCKQTNAFTLVIKGEQKLKNLVLFQQQNVFAVELTTGANKIRLTNYPEACYLMVKSALKSGKWRYLPMIWVPSDTSTVEIVIDAEYNVTFPVEDQYQTELNTIFKASDRFSLFPYEPKEDRPLEPILALEAKGLLQNLKVYTDRSIIVNLLEESKKRKISNWSTDVISAYLNEPEDQVYKSGKLFKIFGMDSLGNPTQVALNKQKFTVLAVSGSWCGPCIKSIPDIRKSYDRLSKDFDFVYLWNDRDLWVFNEMHREKKKPIIWPSIWDKYGLMANALQVTTYPTYILFDQNGMEVKRWEGKFPDSFDRSTSN